MEKLKICVVGLGYVGLPLAVELSKKFSVMGFDTNPERITELKKKRDKTKEVSTKELKAANRLIVTDNPKDLAKRNCYIITVPTPIDEYKKPDLDPVKRATQTVGKYLRKGDLVIYESTVFPGCTEEVCVPILEKFSALKFNVDFYCGYSPERINPGDKKHRIYDIKKVTSGSTPIAAKKVDKIYKSIIKAGTHLVSSIKVAEAAKVIENAQRDLNIAFVNELTLIFDKLTIDTNEVLEAAATKWNFLPFKPGLVGGHCIGVDPYYLTYKAEGMGYHPEVILAGRRINDNMGVFIANKLVKLLSNNGHPVNGCKVLMLGITFKEDCPDIRNSRVIDIIKELESFGISVDVYDPLADPEEVKKEYGVSLLKNLKQKYSGIVLAVAHSSFKKQDMKLLMKRNTVLYDVKGFLDRSIVTARL